jgi:hypothetical protein
MSTTVPKAARPASGIAPSITIGASIPESLASSPAFTLNHVRAGKGIPLSDSVRREDALEWKFLTKADLSGISHIAFAARSLW